MTIKIWDKKESINGISAIEILNSRKDLANESEVILLINEYNTHVDEIALGSTIRGMLKLDNTLTTLEVANAYLKSKDDNSLIEDTKQAKSNAEQITALGSSLAQEKLNNIQLTSTLNNLGEELAKVKLQLIQKSV